MAHCTKLGESPSDETRRKNSESNKAAWARRKAQMTIPTTNPPTRLTPEQVAERRPLFDSVFEVSAAMKQYGIDAVNDFREQLVAAVRNCDWHVDDNVMKLIESFNPAPDDVMAQQGE